MSNMTLAEFLLKKHNYRIIKEVDANNSERFYIQKRKFFMWFYVRFSETLTNQFIPERMHFYSIEAAISHAYELISEDNQKKIISREVIHIGDTISI